MEKTNDSIKRFFKAIRDEQREIEHIQELIQTAECGLLPRAITYDGDKVQVSPEDRFSEVCAKIADYQEQLGRAIVRLNERRLKAEMMVSKLEDVKEREVMRYYYLTSNNGELMTWRQVAIRMNYYEQYVKRIHGRALLHLADKFTIERKTIEL